MVAPLSAIGQVIEAIGMGDGEERKRMNCRRCSAAIRDRFVIKVGKSSYHEACTRCVRCDILLEDKCFEKGGLLYCEEHYFKECGACRCAGCNEGVNPREFVYRHGNGMMVFHVNCHRCVVCARQLDPGERISVDINSRTIACAFHYADPPMMDLSEPGLLMLPPPDEYLAACTASIDPPLPCPVAMPPPPPPMPAMPECLPGPSSEDTHQYMPIDYSAIKQEFPAFFSSFEAFSEYDDESKMLKRRGPRTTIKQNQLDVLNRIFSTTPKPSKHARAKLALETGLSMRVIQVWFQNRRSKERRLKHLCNYLRHYEQRGGMMGGMAAGLGAVGFPTGEGGMVDPNSVLSMEGVDKIRESAQFYADLDMYDEEDEDED